MLGQIQRLADNLWFIHGEMPPDVRDGPDWCNVVIYLAGDRLYLVDSGGGPVMRASIARVLHEVGPVEEFTLINTHGHLDHICNNDLIAGVQAKTKHHYLLRDGINPSKLNAPAYFAEQFDRMDAYVDPFTSYPVNRMTYRVAGWIRDALGLFVGRRRVLEWLFAIQFKKFTPVADSRATMEALDDRPAGPLRIGGTAWTGWRLGPDDLFVMEARAHSDHDVLIYLPEHKMLCMGDVTFPLFPTWADSSRDRILECLRSSQAMVASGDVALLADGHGDRCYQGASEVGELLAGVVDDHVAYEQVLDSVFATADGLTPAEVYARFRRYGDRPVVAKYLALEFPHTPAGLQNVMVTTLLQLGYEPRGARRRQCFHRP